MDIEGIRQKKTELEEIIRKAIADFEESTSVQVTTIGYDRKEFVGLNSRRDNTRVVTYVIEVGVKI